MRREATAYKEEAKHNESDLIANATKAVAEQTSDSIDELLPFGEPNNKGIAEMEAKTAKGPSAAQS